MSSALPSRTEAVSAKLRELAAPEQAQINTAVKHIRATALAALLRALNRQANSAALEWKQQTSDARNGVGQADLGLQNMLYEKRHLEREIQKCNQFASIYQDIPLYDLPKFKQRAPPEAHPDDTSDHQLMLNRLSFELAERQRLSLQKSELTKKKEELLKESKANFAKAERVKSEILALVKAGTIAEKALEELVPSTTLLAMTDSTPMSAVDSDVPMS